MDLCYAIGMLRGGGADSLLIGPEKSGAIKRYALDGEPMETVSEGPGGVMTIAQVPGRTDQVLATSGFFSPNHGGDEARIVCHTRAADGTWCSSLVCALPYVHRFGIVRGADARTWLIACTIKGACRDLKDDWSRPGAIYVGLIDADLASYDAAHPLKMTELACCQVQNHGFWTPEDAAFALVSTAAGVFRFTPPATPDATWEQRCLIVGATSDICAVDLDGDGVLEIVTLAPFHGDTISVWHEAAAPDIYERVWSAPQRREFLHAIWGGTLQGEPAALVGARRGARELLRLSHERGAYRLEVVDSGAGPANCMVFQHAGADVIAAANRETDEIALYAPPRA
ncbi:hypothetical protein [Coriobacterium glomerans]|nr:hypothetical protein [Coriobacterium glomerans]